jgi:hypothetical protein
MHPLQDKLMAHSFASVYLPAVCTRRAVLTVPPGCTVRLLAVLFASWVHLAYQVYRACRAARKSCTLQEIQSLILLQCAVLKQLVLNELLCYPFFVA